MDNLKRMVHYAVLDMLDDFTYQVSSEDSKKLFDAMNDAGYSDLANAWFNYCLDGDEGGWPNDGERISTTGTNR